MRKHRKTKFIMFLALLIGCASGIEMININAATGPNEKPAPEVKYNDVKTYNASYYNDIVGKKSTSLLNGLATISQQNHRNFNTYDELWGGNCYSDADKNDPDNKLIDFYTQLSISNEYRTSNMSGYNANVNWNREHVWCKSLSGGLFKDVSSGHQNAGTDIHHLRPNVANINSSRNNALYGEVDHSYAKYYNETEGVKATSSTGTLYGYLDSSIDSSPATSTKEGVFEPIDKVKGDVARIVMYMYMHYSKNVTSNESYGKAGNLDISNIIFVSNESEWDLLRRWNESDPVDEFESKRNDYCASVTGLRNPFIDHPEFADIIWDGSYNGNGALKDDNSGSETPSYYLNLVTSSTTIEVGNTYQIQVNTNIPTLSYTSSNTTVASVNQSGLITAKSAGTSTITVSGNSISKQFSVTVTNTTPSYYLNLVTSSTTIEVGNTYQIQVNTNIPTLSYTSSNTTVASVNQSGLITAKSAGTSIITVSGNSISKQFNLTVSEKSSGENPDTPSTSQGGWQLVSEIKSLEVNDKVIIVAKESDVAISTIQNGNNRGQTSISKVGTSLEEPSSSVQQFTLEAGTATNTFAFNTGSGYIYAAGNIASGNYLRTQATKDDNASWTITISNDGTATIKTIADKYANIIKHNSSASLFSCYSSGQKDVCLYKYVEETNEDEQPELKFDIATNAELGFKANYTTTTSTTQTTAQYEKVTTELSDWSGTYLIVYETGSIAFNSALTTLDTSGNGANVTINNGVIESNQTTNALSFEISKDGNNYLIKSASGYYIGATSDSNSLLSNKTTKYTNTITLNQDSTVNIIGSGGAYLRYNANTGSGNLRFRYYRSSTYSSQKAICLYKKTNDESIKEETKWEFSDYQLRFSSTFTSDLVLDETYSMESLTFGYIITPKKYLTNYNYDSFDYAYYDNENNLNNTVSKLKAKTGTLNLIKSGNNYSFGFILKGITNPNAELSVAFYVKTQEGDIYFTTTKSTSISSMVDRYLSNDSLLNDYSNKTEIIAALNAMKETF